MQSELKIMIDNNAIGDCKMFAKVVEILNDFALKIGIVEKRTTAKMQSNTGMEFRVEW